MRGAIAAGHPLTAEAGARVLREGGNAVDALLAAAFTAFVTEGPADGPGGRRLPARARAGRRDDAARLLLRRPGDEARRDGRGADRLRGRRDAGLPRRATARSPSPGCSPGWRRRTAASRRGVGRSRRSRARARAKGVECDEPRVFLHRILDRDPAPRRGWAARLRRPGSSRHGRSLPDARAGARRRARPPSPSSCPSSRTISRVPGRDARPLETAILGATASSRRRRRRAAAPSSSAMLELLRRRRRAVARRRGARRRRRVRRVGIGPADRDDAHLGRRCRRHRRGALVDARARAPVCFRGGTQLNNMLGELDVIGAGEQRPGDAPRQHDDADARPRSGSAAARDRQRRLGAPGGRDRPGHLARPVAARMSPTAIRAPRLHVDGDTLHLEGGWADDAVAGLAVRMGRRSLGRAQPLLRRRAGRRANGRRDPRRAGDPRRGGAGWSSHDPRAQGATPGDAPALVELAEAVGGEEGRWILATESWRSVTTSAATSETSSATRMPRSSSPRTTVASSGGSRFPATRIPRAATSRTSG